MKKIATLEIWDGANDEGVSRLEPPNFCVGLRNLNLFRHHIILYGDS